MRRIGVIAAALALFGCLQTPDKPVTETGRFEVVSAQGANSNAILVDTATGDSWSQYEGDNINYPNWVPMDRPSQKEWDERTRQIHQDAAAPINSN